MSQRTSRVIDVVLACWFLLWCLIGLSLGRAVNGLGRLSDGVIGAGQGIVDVGGAIGELSDVPVIGGGVDAIVEEVRSVGRSTVDRGESSKEAIFVLAVVIALLTALGPTAAPIAIWLVLRTPLARERRAVRRALGADQHGIDGYLAMRAVTRMSFTRLRTVSEDPWGDLVAGRWRGLASLELRRLGLPALGTPVGSS